MFDYKKIIKNRDLRIKILNSLRFIPDEYMLKIQYYLKTGRKLHLKNPKRYTEKLQWYKLYYRDPLMQICADKYEVRKYVQKIIGKKYLNELYGIYNNPNEINFNDLPNNFILKDTMGCYGDDSMIIVFDKDKLDIRNAIYKMNKWVNEPIFNNIGKEWVYEKKHRIIAEKLLISNKQEDLPDYKFFCFGGKVFCSYMMQNYTLDHNKGELGFFNKNYELLPYYRKDFNPIKNQPPKPINYESMVILSEQLSKDFPHVRVDFYNIKGKIIFGELTFFNASGYVNFVPDEFDYILGKYFILPEPNYKQIS